jgi:hypothetical protein
MSYEKQVREQHKYEAKVLAFEREVKLFIKRCNRLQREELELMMARLLDKIKSQSDQKKILHARFVGSLVKMVYDERMRGVPRSLFFNPLAHWSTIPLGFTYPDPLDDASLDDLTNRYCGGVKLLSD